MTDLILPLKGEYFDQIKSGEKTEEYRLCNSYWQRRLKGRTFNRIILTRGYPKRDDNERRIVRAWNGWRMKLLTHPHFGPNEVSVYAIDVSIPYQEPPK